MRVIFAFLINTAIGFLLLMNTAFATTYDYIGLPLTVQTSGNCYSLCPTSAAPITGSVTFDFDTSQYTGILALTTGDTAFLTNTLPQGLVSGSATYPTSTTWFNPPLDTYGFQGRLSGTFTLLNGQIISWDLAGSTGSVGCGAGPGCAAGSTSVDSEAGSDTATSDPGGYPGTAYYAASNSGGGDWNEQVTAVPKPSTWAMLLVGFAAIGFAACRRSQQKFAHS